MSPNDNHYHGVAKAKWKENCENFDDDIYSSLNLLRELNAVPAVEIKKWFNNNLFLDTETVTSELTKAHIEGGKKFTPQANEFFEECKALYQRTIRSSMKTRLVSNQVSNTGLDSLLDGSYWK